MAALAHVVPVRALQSLRRSRLRCLRSSPIWALELAPARVNLIAAGFVNTQLSASLLGDNLEKRREELRRILPIRRVVEPADVAALAVHIMSNKAMTGATYDIDGGQQLVS
ncbi:SDR family oxidoreductase [Mesorhizobium sp. M7A.F.Ca.US.010.02.1.1]|uniref:SDR family oxidoreductase n=1 Tax=unclassified Mesorhizobium TaxID=325217 RepID=UPI0032AED860